MNLNLLLAVGLQVIAVAAGMAEVVIPSGGILAVISAACFGYSLFVAFTAVSTTAGVYLLAADAVLIPVMVIAGFKLLARSPAALRKELSRKAGVSSQAPELERLLGRDGIAITDLRPAGTAKIEGKRVDVVTRGEYISRSSPVRVITVSGNRVVVKTAVNSPSGAEPV